MRTWIYGQGCPEGNENIYLERFERHNREVLEHFRERPDDLLIMDFSQGDGWEKLALFLGINVPRLRFRMRIEENSEKRTAGWCEEPWVKLSRSCGNWATTLKYGLARLQQKHAGGRGWGGIGVGRQLEFGRSRQVRGRAQSGQGRLEAGEVLGGASVDVELIVQS